MSEIELTEDQREELEKLWWVYGNSGKKCTLQNHKLIQGFLHYGEDRREVYIQGNENMRERFGDEYVEKHGLTQECLDKVNEIIDG